jgi:hypothetical protein
LAKKSSSIASWLPSKAKRLKPAGAGPITCSITSRECGPRSMWSPTVTSHFSPEIAVASWAITASSASNCSKQPCTSPMA